MKHCIDCKNYSFKQTSKNGNGKNICKLGKDISQSIKPCDDFVDNEAVDNLQIHYEAEEKIATMQELYYLYCGMSLSMQKAVKDIMIVANGGEIDD